MAKKENKKEVYSRKWINPKKGSAFVITEAYYYKKPYSYHSGRADVYPEFSGTITMKDCFKQIELEFACFNPRRVEQRLQKIKVLKESLDTMEQMLLEYQALCKDKPWLVEDETVAEEATSVNPKILDAEAELSFGPTLAYLRQGEG